MRGELLTAEQFVQYSKAHRRLLSTLSVAVVYCLGVGILDELVPLEAYGLYVALGFFPIIGLGIWGMAGFRCPVCGSTPRAKSFSFTSSEATYSSMVALLPKECSFCAVRFRPRSAISEA